MTSELPRMAAKMLVMTRIRIQDRFMPRRRKAYLLITCVVVDGKGDGTVLASVQHSDCELQFLRLLKMQCCSCQSYVPESTCHSHRRVRSRATVK